jgi:transcriptional regulator with XRE-family HTH domain/prefoldin subunit 5
MTLGQKIKATRIDCNLTQKELAGNYITRNMLSQIENDSATPSIKTLYFLAKKLAMPISYFVDDHYQESKKYSLVTELLTLYDEHKYLEAIKLLEDYFDKHPQQIQNALLKNIYMNSCLQSAIECKKNGKYQEAKGLYDKLLTYESDMLFESDVCLYNIYSQLAELSIHLDTVEALKDYEDKAKGIVDKMVIERQIQNIYISFVEGDYKAVLNKIKGIEFEQLDRRNKGRYCMIIGSTFYYMKDCEQATEYLEKAVEFYKNSTYNSVIKIIYENLSKCYSNLNNYEKAYEYLSLSRE